MFCLCACPEKVAIPYRFLLLKSSLTCPLSQYQVLYKIHKGQPWCHLPIRKRTAGPAGAPGGLPLHRTFPGLRGHSQRTCVLLPPPHLSWTAFDAPSGSLPSGVSFTANTPSVLRCRCAFSSPHSNLTPASKPKWARRVRGAQCNPVMSHVSVDRGQGQRGVSRDLKLMAEPRGDELEF